MDECLYFANKTFLADQMLYLIADQSEVKRIVLICSAINFVDASIFESLERLTSQLRDAGVRLHLTEVKGPIIGKLDGARFLSDLKPGNIYLSTHEAVIDLDCV